jgi:hypothetical protein
MSGLEGVKPGDRIMTCRRFGRGQWLERVVAKAARVYVTDETGDRFRVVNGIGGSESNMSTRALTMEQWEAMVRESGIAVILHRWGLHPSPSRMSVERQGRVADLLREFEQEDAAKTEGGQ